MCSEGANSAQRLANQEESSLLSKTSSRYSLPLVAERSVGARNVVGGDGWLPKVSLAHRNGAARSCGVNVVVSRLRCSAKSGW